LFDVVGVQFIHGNAESIDSAARQVGYIDANGQRQQLGYDRLILAAGSQVARPAVPGLAEHSFDVDQMESAVRLEQHLIGLAKLPASPARNTVVVCGGGFTGIETATEMTPRLRAILGEGNVAWCWWTVPTASVPPLAPASPRPSSPPRNTPVSSG
jgi:NADH dehydrogenase